MAVGIVGFGLAPGLWLSLPAAALVGAGCGNIYPLTMSMVGQLPGPRPERNVATLALVAFTAFLVGPPRSARWRSVGLPVALALLAPLGLAPLALLLAAGGGRRSAAVDAGDGVGACRRRRSAGRRCSPWSPAWSGRAPACPPAGRRRSGTSTGWPTQSWCAGGGAVAARPRPAGPPGFNVGAGAERQDEGDAEAGIGAGMGGLRYGRAGGHASTPLAAWQEDGNGAPASVSARGQMRISLDCYHAAWMIAPEPRALRRRPPPKKTPMPPNKL